MAANIKINRYHCGFCGQDMVTREDRAALPEDFTSPFIIECRGFVDGKPCGKSAQSAMYRNCEDLKPAFEWRAARKEELQGVGPNRRQYLAQGGISLWPIPVEGAEVEATEV
jgi:hypothetical protein